MSLEALRISEAPAAFAAMAAKHNLLVDLVASLTGEAGIKVTVSAGRLLITGTAPWTEAEIYDIAYNAAVDAALAGDITIDAAHVSDFDEAAAAAAPVQSVNGYTGVVDLLSSDISDFDAGAIAAVLPITSADVTDFDAAAAAAAPVQSVNGSTGVVDLLSSDISDFDAGAIAAVLPITSVDVTDFAAAAAAAAPVQSVAGEIGNVTLAWADITDVTQETIEVCNLGNINFLTS